MSASARREEGRRCHRGPGANRSRIASGLLVTLIGALALIEESRTPQPRQVASIFRAYEDPGYFFGAAWLLPAATAFLPAALPPFGFFAPPLLPGPLSGIASPSMPLRASRWRYLSSRAMNARRHARDARATFSARAWASYGTRSCKPLAFPCASPTNEAGGLPRAHHRPARLPASPSPAVTQLATHRRWSFPSRRR